MLKIGEYRAAEVYEMTVKEYEMVKKVFQDRGHIALIDGVMVKNGKVIGVYDGAYVTPYDEPYEDYEPAIASIVEEPWCPQEEVVESEPEDISKPETANFDFSELTKEVDSFFERLKKEG